MGILALLSMLLTLVAPTVTMDSSWFDTEGRDLIEESVAEIYPEMSTSDIEDLEFSSAVPVGLVSDNGLNADNINRLAAVIIDEEPIGVVVANPTSDDPLIGVYNDDRLTSVVSGLGGGDKLYYDEDLDAYFLQVEENIEPASENATEYVLGPIPLENFMKIRNDLVVEGMPAAQLTPAQESDSNPIIIVLLILGAAFLTVLVVTWLRASSAEEEAIENEITHRRKVRIYRRGEHNVDVGD